MEINSHSSELKFLSSLVRAAPEHPGGGGQAGDEAQGALGQRGLLEGLAECLRRHAGGHGVGLLLALETLLARHSLTLLK